MLRSRKYISFNSYLLITLFVIFSNIGVIESMLDFSKYSDIEIFADDLEKEKENSEKEGKGKDEMCVHSQNLIFSQAVFKAVRTIEFIHWKNLHPTPSYPPPELFA